MADRIAELQLSQFKGFERFRIQFPASALIVGPNNAGKSTLSSALRATAQMLRYATSRQPDRSRRDKDRWLLSYALTSDRTDLTEENLRHEFRGLEARIHLRFTSGCSITAVWPPEATMDADDPDDPFDPFFYLEVNDRPQPRQPRDVRALFPSVGIVPTLSPVDLAEDVISEERVRRTIDTRLSSRHFRNGLWLIDAQDAEGQDTFQEFLDFAEPWLPELEITWLTPRDVPGTGQQLDLFYREPGRRAEKEIAWAGDGLQVWLQLLFHIFRLRNSDVIVLDEPDLYLHADLQRRLVRLLDATPCQTITATHSSEMLAESTRANIVWVDRSRRAAVRAPRDELLSDVAVALGSQFNLRLAKALRARTVLFVEGDDMQLIGSLARTVGANRLAVEMGVAVVPIHGYSNWEHIEPFKWFMDEFLQGSVTTFVVLDRDYRPDSVVQRVLARLREIGIHPHVWKRKELESYLIEIPVIARISGASEEQVSELLRSCTDELKERVFARALEEERVARVGPRAAGVTVTENFQRAFAEEWQSLGRRLHQCPPKELIHLLNRRLDDAGLPTISARGLAAAITSDELATEASDLITEIEETL